jgi:hypothetical protein
LQRFPARRHPHRFPITRNVVLGDKCHGSGRACDEQCSDCFAVLRIGSGDSSQGKAPRRTKPIAHSGGHRDGDIRIDSTPL